MEGADDHFALKWNNFQSNFASSFHNLLQAEDLVDVTIAAEGKFIQAHKIILSVCSPYFKDLFKVNPCKHPVVILKDVRHQELSDMLDFMYRGEVSVRHDELPSFLKLAENLKVKGLAAEKDEILPQTQAFHRKPMPNVKKKKVMEQAVFESDDAVMEFSPSPGEPKRKRRRAPSPQYKTESVNEETGTLELCSPKREIEQPGDVEFLEEIVGDPLDEYMSKNKHDVTTEFEESNLDITADDGQEEAEEMSGSIAGPSGIDESTDQVPPGNKLGKSTTPVWRYFHKDELYSVCQLCDRRLRLHGTSGLVRHLRTKHMAEYEKYREEYSRRLRSKGSPQRVVLPSSNVKRLLFIKNAAGPDADCITSSDLAVLQQEKIRVLNVVKQSQAAIESLTPADDVQVVFVDNVKEVGSSGSKFMVVSGQEEIVNS